MELARHDILNSSLASPGIKASQDSSVFVLNFHHKVDGVLATNVKGKLGNHRANAWKKLWGILHALPSTKENSCSVSVEYLFDGENSERLLLPNIKYGVASQRQRPFNLSV